MNTIRAKFRVDAITKRKGWKAGEILFDVELNPVTGESAENKAFYAATPCGQIKLGTLNEAAANAFALSGEYYVDFIPAS